MSVGFLIMILINNFQNELGSQAGTPAAGQTWEINNIDYENPIQWFLRKFPSGNLGNTNGSGPSALVMWPWPLAGR